MNFFQRISVCAVVCGAVACGKNGADSVAPVGEPETVVIGCAGAEIEVRTQIDDDLSVRWTSGDEIRFWAREHGASAFLSEVRNIPFRFDYYSPKWSRAGFTGTIVGVTDVFDAGKQYDYYAVSPAPAAESDVNGTWVAYTVPDVQDGAFDGRCDILTARLEQAPALQKGDNNPAVDLKFTHHLHAMKFTVPQNALGEKISAIELTFPRPVVGRMVVDMAGEAADDFSGLDRNKLTIEFPKGEEKDAGDTFFAMVAPIAFESGEQIEMRIIGMTGETSVDYTFARPTAFVAEHLTPVLLYVPAMNTYYTVVEFSVVDNDRAEHAGKANLFGVNTLGERVQTVRLKGEAGAFANAVRMSNGCSVSDDGSVLTYAVPADGDGVCTLSFVSEKSADSKCPWEKWNSRALSGKMLDVEYESANALIQSQNGRKAAAVTVPTIQHRMTNSLALSVPYFFEEDFCNCDGLDINGTNSSHNATGEELNDTMFICSGWTGNQVAGYAGYFEIKTRVESTRIAAGLYNGRLDSAPMKYWKNDNERKLRLAVRFDYYHHAGSSANYTRTMNYGTTETQGAIQAYYSATVFSRGGNHVSGLSLPLSVDNGGTVNDWIIENATNATRLSWELEVTGNPETGNHNHVLRLSNLKVSIIPE